MTLGKRRATWDASHTPDQGPSPQKSFLSLAHRHLRLTGTLGRMHGPEALARPLAGPRALGSLYIQRTDYASTESTLFQRAQK